MPPINIYKCNSCNFVLHEGWGGYQYVEDEDDQRIICPHPGENKAIAKILKFENKDRFQKPKWWWSSKRRTRYESIKNLVANKTGFNSICICLECKQFCNLDIGNAETAKNSWRNHYGAINKKDKRVCPACNSKEIKTIFELIGDICPICCGGKIIEIETGMIA